MLFGVLLPLLFHLLGNASVFLPMHIPIMIGGFILSWPYALAVAILTPLLNCIFTGMPGPIYLLYMIPELVAYTLIINILFRKNEKKHHSLKKVYLTLGISIIIGRMISSLFQAIFIANNQDMISFFAASLITGLPGITVTAFINTCYTVSFL